MRFFLLCSVVLTSTVAYRPSIYDTPGSGVSAASEAAVNRYMNQRYAPQSVAPPTSDVKLLRRPKWGVDNTCPSEYWFDDRIHTLGNHGFWGALHAAMAPMSTKIIDLAAYNGIDIRKQVTRCGAWLLFFKPDESHDFTSLSNTDNEVVQRTLQYARTYHQENLWFSRGGFMLWSWFLDTRSTRRIHSTRYHRDRNRYIPTNGTSSSRNICDVLVPGYVNCRENMVRADSLCASRSLWRNS
jgi:hypothetical protein